MRQTLLFAKTFKESIGADPTLNAQLLIKGGFVDKTMAGVYSYLPLGLRVLRKIEAIVREEMNKIGGQEILMPALHPSENWKTTGAWDNLDVLFKLYSRTGREYALGQSEEEIVTPLVKKFLKSYKDLPIAVYQIQNKFRDELRSKSGILRGREFGMKDMYSFHIDQEDFEKFYEKVKKSYFNIFERCNLQALATEASGGSFSEKISYEFMVITEAGEDDIIYCPECGYCVNLEISQLKQNDICPKCNETSMNKARASEAGNVFDLSRKYVKDFNLTVTDKKGNLIYPVMGCYGLGTTRLMGITVERFNDEKGIMWPRNIAPFHVHLLSLNKEKEIVEKANELYKNLGNMGIEVLFDDRLEKRPGEKLTDSDLIGIPIRLIISSKTKEKIELKYRDQKQTELLSFDQITKIVKKYYNLKSS
jgi:prolyl-tRNA synthetase